MNRKSLIELGKLIKKDIENQENYIKAVEGDKNPQVEEMRMRAEARKEAMEDVMQYIKNGSTIFFGK